MLFISTRTQLRINQDLINKIDLINKTDNQCHYNNEYDYPPSLFCLCDNAHENHQAGKLQVQSSQNNNAHAHGPAK